jgi:hypothetical protein
VASSQVSVASENRIRVWRRSWRSVVVTLMLGGLCHACSLAHGSFHQVTSIRGTVVGSRWLPFRWLRQSFNVTDATLTLYEYRFPARMGDLRKLAIVKTNRDGSFDFGRIPNGHYTLVVGVKDSDRMGAWFDVEVTNAVRSTKKIALDVSPIQPDCTGGNEFIESKS